MMRKLPFAIALTLGVLGAIPSSVGTANADTIVIQNQGSKWKFADTTGSPPLNPLPVEIKKGDIIEFKIVSGGHGVATIDKPATQSPSPALNLVILCGEAPESKPDAVLREVECGNASQFNKVFVGSVKLEVSDKFQNDVNFWCIVHAEDMWGILKLKV